MTYLIQEVKGGSQAPALKSAEKASHYRDVD